MRMVIASAAVVLTGALAYGCGDTCTQLCDEAADFHERCLDSWGQTWETMGFADAADFNEQCLSGVDTSRACVDDWCAAQSLDDEAAAQECASNEELGILRGCEADKALYRQPCEDYWQSLVQFGDPVLDTDPATCNEVPAEE